MRKTINPAHFGIAFGLIILTAFGAFFDFEISRAIYLGYHPQENLFGVIFAFIGTIPTFVGWSFLGACILSLARREDVVRRRRLIALAVFLFILSLLFFCNNLTFANNNAFSVHFAIGYPIGIIICAIAAYVGYRLTEKSDNPVLLSRLLFLVLVSLIVMVVVMGAKEILARPRFRFVYEADVAEYFINFWQSGADIKAAFPVAAANDEFTSFPSGHSAYSMFAIFIFPFVCELVPRLKMHKGLFFTLGVIWWGLTAFSRLTMGAHYLTDVTISALVVVFVYEILRIIKALKKKNA